MNARCSICLETLKDESSPMTTLCGHLYCLDCATYNFADSNSTCAICRRPHGLDTLIKLYPDYERDGEKEQSSSSSGPLDVANIGVGVLDACYNVLRGDAFDAASLGPALARTDELVEGLSRWDVPDIRNLLKSIVTVLREIRSKLDAASRIPEMQEERDHLQATVRRLRDKLKEANRGREQERASTSEYLLQQQVQWNERLSDLQDKLQQTKGMLGAESAKVAACRLTIENVEAEVRKWRAYANRYKKKYYTLKKDHEIVRNGLDDAFFPDDSLEVI